MYQKCTFNLCTVAFEYNPSLTHALDIILMSHNHTNGPDKHRYVIHLSDQELPSSVLDILSLDDKFNNTNKIDKPTAFSFYKNVE